MFLIRTNHLNHELLAGYVVRALYSIRPYRTPKQQVRKIPRLEGIMDYQLRSLD